jgi:hypothetical protein
VDDELARRRAVIGNPNLLPVEVSAEGGNVRWREVGECPFSHGSFEWSLEDWDPRHAFRPGLDTPLSLLAREDFAVESVEPTAFVYHASRCGSSLLARALAQDPRIVVMSEVAPLNQLLTWLCRGNLRRPIEDPLALRTLRNFVLALGRRRRPEQRHFLVKFTSWNVLLRESIEAVFPKVPALFLYRDPTEVMVSLLSKPAGFVRNRQGAWVASLAGVEEGRLAALSDAEYVARCVESLLRAGLASPRMALLGYPALGPPALPALLRWLGIECTPAELEPMRSQFRFDAKAFQRDVPFRDDSAAKQRAASAEVRAAVARFLALPHRELEASPRNLRLAAVAEA